MHETIANINPPTTGDGIQNVSRNFIRFFKNAPKNNTATAIPSVWYISKEI